MTDQQYMDKMNPIDREAFETYKSEYANLGRNLEDKSQDIIAKMYESLEDDIVLVSPTLPDSEMCLSQKIDAIKTTHDDLKKLQKEHYQKKLQLMIQMKELKAKILP